MATKKQECMIIGAVPIESDEIWKEFDPKKYFVICADAGYDTAKKFGITPDLIVGDFDSVEKKPTNSRKVLSLPVEKDVTDTMYAVMKGFANGFRSFVLLGCLGGLRFDHSIANLDVLQYILERGGCGVIANETTKVFLIHDSRLRLTQMQGATVSVFPYAGASCDVTYLGLQYPMDHETLTCGGTVMGVSNSIVSDSAEIRVHSGTALIVTYQS